jgi:CheY-like chemotaxis protein
MSPKSSGEPRLLLANYHDDMNRMLERMLRLESYDVAVATTLEEARVLLEERTYALLLSRNAMPDGEGPELIDFAWKRYALPAVAITGALAPAKMAARCHPDALRGVLWMPFSCEDLFFAVAKGLGRPDIAGPDAMGHYRVVPPVSCPNCRGGGETALLVTRTKCPCCAGRGVVYPETDVTMRLTQDTSAPARTA